MRLTSRSSSRPVVIVAGVGGSAVVVLVLTSNNSCIELFFTGAFYSCVVNSIELRG